MSCVVRFLLSSAVVVLLATQASFAVDLETPSGDVTLTVSGKVGKINPESGAEQDIAILEALGGTSVVTTTIWTKGPQTFEGVELAALVEALGIEGQTLLATAINDYTVVVPLPDAIEGGPITAYAANGSEMSVRNKGPLWLIYPSNAEAKYRSELIYSRSIWQLNRIEVKN